MDLENNEGLNCIFDELAESLNISETMRDNAERAYTALGEWIEDNPEGEAVEAYTQGSFALGTVVRPPSGEDLDYDIDLVCQLPGMVESTAEEIKKFVGTRIREHGTYAKKLCPEGKRCWTLDYDVFHVDVLPCVDDPKRGGTGVRLTHKDPGTGEYSDRYSNPKGYAKWFEERMGDSLTEAKRRYSGRAYCSVEDVPTFVVRTPLQKAIQILKHHRNLMFEGADNAPISIIISTLAAWAYGGEQGTYNALVGILERMDAYISGGPGRYRIANPVDEKENFAEKWNESPEKAAAFFSWLDRARKDFLGLSGVRGLDAITRSLESSCGKAVSFRAMNQYGDRLREARESSSLFAASAGLTYAASPSARAVPRHEFYGA